MNAGMTLQNLTSEVTRQQHAKRDFMAPLGRVGMIHTEHGLGLGLMNGSRQDFGLLDLGHQNVAEEAGIPKPYYDRLRRSYPDLLTQNVNTLFHSDAKKMRMVRTLDGNVRAILSDRYRCLDNYDLLSAILPVLEQHRVEVVSSSITERKLYLKVILPTLEATVMEKVLTGAHERANIVVASLVISNSEVGSGAFSVSPGVYDHSCTNLMVMSTRFMRKYHIGRVGTGDGDSIEELLTTATKSARDKAFWMTVKDVMENTFSNSGFADAVGEINRAASDRVESKDLPAVIECASEQFGIGKENRPMLLTHFAQRGDFSRWGLSSAITRLANDLPDYEQSSELERLGGRILELPRSDWNAISTAVSRN